MAPQTRTDLKEIVVGTERINEQNAEGSLHNPILSEPHSQAA